jgi:alkylhydroperoxidase family enzyme
VSRTEGISEEELQSLRGVEFDRTGGRFSEREMVALAYADAVTTSNTVADGLFEMVRQHFSEEEIIELTATIAWEICAAKFNRALEIEWSGQSTCPLPVPLS